MTLLQLFEILKEHGISANVRYEQTGHGDRWLIILTKRHYTQYRKYIVISPEELEATKEPDELIKFAIKKAIDELNRLPKN